MIGSEYTHNTYKNREKHKNDRKGSCQIKTKQFIGNPENEFPNRRQIAKVACGYKDPHYLYKVFAVDELAQIEKEGLEIRRKHCWRQSAAVVKDYLKKPLPVMSRQ